VGLGVLDSEHANPKRLRASVTSTEAPNGIVEIVPEETHLDALLSCQ
jgi:hypothetical protein